MKITAQPGPQFEFLSTPADIAIYGGAAGGGKSYALLLESLRHSHNPRFGGVVFRRTKEQIRVEGGLWDTSADIFPLFGARGSGQSLTWRFPSGAAVSMAGIEHEKDLSNYQGAQIPYIAFDELTHFTEKQFWYMMSRNRSSSGVAGYIRAACNPDPDSWVKRFIQWWLDPKSGLPIKGRAGVLRFFVRVGDDIHWAFSKAELVKKFGDKVRPKSLTFIPASVHDNRILMDTDPDYLASLMALPLVERAQLLDGNWEVRPAAGLFFKRHYFGIVDDMPADVVDRVRFWDRAGTPVTPKTPDPDWSVGVRLAKTKSGFYFIEHVERLRDSSHKVEEAILNMAEQDGKDVRIGYRQDPGSAGKGEAEDLGRKLAAKGLVFQYKTVTGDKRSYAKPVSAAAEAGNIKMLRGPWNEPVLRVLENFDVGLHDDDVDGLSGAFEMLTSGRFIMLA